MSMFVTAGATDVTVPVYFVDDDGGTAPGEPTTGLLFSNIETGGSASYQRQGAARVDFSLVTVAVAGAHTDGGFILIDDTNMPGLYRLDVPDLAFAVGADYVVIMLQEAGANNTLMRPLMVMLTDFDLQDAIPTVNAVEFAGETIPPPAATGVPDVNVTHQGDGAIPAPAATGVPDVNVTHYLDGVIPAQGVTGVPDVNVTHQVDGIVPAPNTAGIPDVNVQEILDTLVSLTGADLDVNVATVASAAGDTIARKVLPQINQAFNDIQALMVDETDHSTPETGLSLTVTRAINSGSFAAATGTVTEMSLGFYQFDASAADMNGAVITFRFQGTGADDTFITVRTAA